MGEDHNGWDVWGKAVLGDLKELKKFAKDQTETTTEILVEMAALKKELKFKASVWNILAGMVPVLTGLVICILTGVL